jgi:hypothetical protein
MKYLDALRNWLMGIKKTAAKESSKKETPAVQDYSIWDAQFQAAIKAGQKREK